MSAAGHDTPAARLATAVTKLSKSPAVLVSGHAGTLKDLVDFLGDQQRRLVDAEIRLALLERKVCVLEELARHE